MENYEKCKEFQTQAVTLFFADHADRALLCNKVCQTRSHITSVPEKVGQSDHFWPGRVLSAGTCSLQKMSIVFHLFLYLGCVAPICKNAYDAILQ